MKLSGSQQWSVKCSQCSGEVLRITGAEKRWIMDPSGAVEAAVIDADAGISAIELFPEVTFDLESPSFDTKCVFQFVLCKICSKAIGKLYRSVTTRASAYLGKLVLCKPQVVFQSENPSSSKANHLAKSGCLSPDEPEYSGANQAHSNRKPPAERPHEFVNNTKCANANPVLGQDPKTGILQKESKQIVKKQSDTWFYDFEEVMHGIVTASSPSKTFETDFCNEITSVTGKMSQSTRKWSDLHSRIMIYEEIYKLVQEVIVALANYQQRRLKDRSKRIQPINEPNQKYLR